jgi:hypothetical protein
MSLLCSETLDGSLRPSVYKYVSKNLNAAGFSYTGNMQEKNEVL